MTAAMNTTSSTAAPKYGTGEPLGPGATEQRGQEAAEDRADGETAAVGGAECLARPGATSAPGSRRCTVSTYQASSRPGVEHAAQDPARRCRPGSRRTTVAVANSRQGRDVQDRACDDDGTAAEHAGEPARGQLERHDQRRRGR